VISAEVTVRQRKGDRLYYARTLHEKEVGMPDSYENARGDGAARVEIELGMTRLYVLPSGEEVWLKASARVSLASGQSEAGLAFTGDLATAKATELVLCALSDTAEGLSIAASEAAQGAQPR